MRKLRVLYLTTSFIIGGAERVTLDLAKSLDPDRYDVAVGTVTESNADPQVREALMAELADRGIPFFSLGRRPFERSLAPLWRLWRRLQADPVDILHTGCLHPDFYGLLVGFLARVPVRIRTLHAQEVWRPNSRRLAPFIDPFLNRLATHITAVSRDAQVSASKELGLDPGRVRVIPNGVDLRRFDLVVDREALRQELGLGPGPVIGLVGRHTASKDIPTFLRAAQRLASHPSRPTFVLVGDGEQRGELEALVDTLGIREQVRFLGQRKDVPRVLQAFDVAVNSSLCEGLSIAVLEAFAAGRPVVATTISSNQLVIRHEESGLLVPVKDPAAMASALSRYLEDPALAKRVADLGHRYVCAEFGLPRMVQRYEALYQEAARQCLPHFGGAGLVEA